MLHYKVLTKEKNDKYSFIWIRNVSIVFQIINAVYFVDYSENYTVLLNIIELKTQQRLLILNIQTLYMCKKGLVSPDSGIQFNSSGIYLTKLIYSLYVSACERVCVSESVTESDCVCLRVCEFRGGGGEGSKTRESVWLPFGLSFSASLPGWR